MTLPPGQRARTDFPRFGLDHFADRMPVGPHELTFNITVGSTQPSLTIGMAALATLPRVEQTSDLHCVTTWTATGIRWSGYRFRDIYEQLIVPGLKPTREVKMLVFRSLDGYRSRLLLEDALALDVLLADRLEGAPIPDEHGAPLRLVAPRHYGYKQAKHVCAIELHSDVASFRFPGPRFMEHLRGRAALEERAQGLPGWLVRWLYRPLVAPTVRKFARARPDATQPSGDR